MARQAIAPIFPLFFLAKRSRRLSVSLVHQPSVPLRFTVPIVRHSLEVEGVKSVEMCGPKWVKKPPNIVVRMNQQVDLKMVHSPTYK